MQINVVRMKGGYLTHLVFLTLGYVLSLLVYQKGFLQKRHVLPGKTRCRVGMVFTSTNCASLGKSACSDVLAHPHCWIRPQFNRSIWLVVDALRQVFRSNSQLEHVSTLDSTS